jgi:hypothetical protein
MERLYSAVQCRIFGLLLSVHHLRRCGYRRHPQRAQGTLREPRKLIIIIIIIIIIIMLALRSVVG